MIRIEIQFKVLMNQVIYLKLAQKWLLLQVEQINFFSQNVLISSGQYIIIADINDLLYYDLNWLKFML